MGNPLAARSRSQWQDRSLSGPQASKCCRKKLPVKVDTIDPVSTRHGTTTPPMTTSTCGQAATSLASSPSPKRTGEPITAPPELWLCSSAGASFPNAGLKHVACSAEGKLALRIVNGEEHALLRTPWQNGQVAGIACKLLGHGKEGDCAAD